MRTWRSVFAALILGALTWIFWPNVKAVLDVVVLDWWFRPQLHADIGLAFNQHRVQRGIMVRPHPDRDEVTAEPGANYYASLFDLGVPCRLEFLGAARSPFDSWSDELRGRITLVVKLTNRSRSPATHIEVTFTTLPLVFLGLDPYPDTLPNVTYREPREGLTYRVALARLRQKDSLVVMFSQLVDNAMIDSLQGRAIRAHRITVSSDQGGPGSNTFGILSGRELHDAIFQRVPGSDLFHMPGTIIDDASGIPDAIKDSIDKFVLLRAPPCGVRFD